MFENIEVMWCVLETQCHSLCLVIYGSPQTIMTKPVGPANSLRHNVSLIKKKIG